jgi:hypothetical protein
LRVNFKTQGFCGNLAMRQLDRSASNPAGPWGVKPMEDSCRKRKDELVLVMRHIKKHKGFKKISTCKAFAAFLY